MVLAVEGSVVTVRKSIFLVALMFTIHTVSVLECVRDVFSRTTEAITFRPVK